MTNDLPEALDGGISHWSLGYKDGDGVCCFNDGNLSRNSFTHILSGGSPYKIRRPASIAKNHSDASGVSQSGD